MTANRRWGVIMPWEPDPSTRTPERPQMTDRAPERPVLYGPHGEPLVRPRQPFGFAPPSHDARRGR